MRIARAIAPALAVWLSGVACLLACTSMCARAADARPGGEHPCCHRSAEIEAEESGCAAAPAAEVRGEPSFDSCCFLRSRASLPGPVPKSVGAPLAPAVDRGVAIAADPAPPAAAPAAAFPVLNRGSTYLRCCVFLI
jgi:hypothetical protein